MSKRESLNRQFLIIKLLRKHSASFEQISEMLQNESEMHGYDYNVSVRTFQRDCQDIASLYSIEIVYDKYKKAYCIQYDQQPELSERMLEALDTVNALRISNNLSEFIHFESRKPRGTELLHGLIYAIKNKIKVSFLYEKFDEQQAFTRIIEPYALKEFKSRWYLVGNDTANNKVKTYGLDRISDLEIEKAKFVIPNEFNYDKYYKDSFGIITIEDIKPVEVLLLFQPITGQYIKSMPLHHSQKVLKDDKKGVLISLTVCITFDFIVEILSHGEHVKVISPKSLIDQILESLNNSISNYKEIF